MSSLIAVVAGYVRALKHIAKDDGGKARFLHFLQRSLTREIVEGFIGSKVMVTLSKTLEALCKERCAHPTYIEQTEKDAQLQLTNRMKRSGVSDIREEVGNPHRGAIPILLATVVFDRNGLEELLSIPGGEWCYERVGVSGKENPATLHGAVGSWRTEAEDRYGPMPLTLRI